MCCCSVGIIIMKSAPSLFLCGLYPLFISPLHFLLFSYSSLQFLFSLSRICLLCFFVFVIFFIYSTCLSWFSFPSSSTPRSPSRGSSVIGAVPVISPRAAGSGQRSLRAGVCPGRCPPFCPPLRPSPRAHPAPAPPGCVDPRDAKVHESKRTTTAEETTFIFWLGLIDINNTIKLQPNLDNIKVSAHGLQGLLVTNLLTSFS